MRCVVLTLLLCAAFAGTAHAQPCGSYRHVALPPGELERLTHAIRVDLDRIDDAHLRPSVRIAAARDVAREMETLRHHYGLCDRPTALDEAAFVALTNGSLERPSVTVELAEDACARAIAQSHGLAPDASFCLDADPRRRLATRGLLRWPVPAGFQTDDADAAAAFFDQQRAALAARPGDRALRLEVTAMALATGDVTTAVATVAPLSANDADATLLRAAAAVLAGNDALARSLFAAVARRAPQRPEAHLDLALLGALDRRLGTISDRELAKAEEHLLDYLCLSAGHLTPEDADDATGLLQSLEEARSGGDSAWGWHGAQPPLPVPLAVLGPDAHTIFDARTPVRESCGSVLGRLR